MTASVGRLHHDDWADWERCENCGTEVAPLREFGKVDAPVKLHEWTGTVNGKPTVGEHTPRRCAGCAPVTRATLVTYTADQLRSRVQAALDVTGTRGETP